MIRLKLPADLKKFRRTCFTESSFINEPKYVLDLPEVPIYEGLNIVKLLAPNETKHSRLLGELLNPKGQHGFGKLFLALFFEHVLSDTDFTDEDSDAWIVTVEKERFDIRIRNQNNSKIIILENKSNEAGDQPNQLYRYWYRGIYCMQNHFPIDTYSKILYLSPGDSKSPDEQTLSRPEDLPSGLPKSVPLDKIKTVYYDREIYNWLEACGKKVEKDSEIYYCIKQYKDFWRPDMSSILEKVNECFSDKQQWETFCDLSPKQGDIRDGWLLKLKPALNQRFSPENLADGWEFYSSDHDYRWYLKKFGHESLHICLWHGEGAVGTTTDFCLWANSDEVKIHTVYQLLREKEYSPVLGAFERKDWCLEDENDGYAIIEKGNWKFGDKNDGNLDLNTIAWYANYKTDEFVAQIQRKVDAFMRNEKITQLLFEINEKASKKKK
jgi:hypothetical protein